LVSDSGVDWQEYEPAIRLWERISGIPAPYPAALGPRGGIKPSPEFVEWMMAVPTGHVSGVPGLSINEKLKLLGNGVVPLSAEKAIRCLVPTTPRKEEMMTTQDTSSFFTTHQSRDVPRDQWGRYELPDPTTGEKMKGWTRATTFAATMAEQYGLSIWKQRQVVWGLSRRPDLLTMAQTISGPEDKKALGAIVDESHIAAGTQAKANKGSAVHSACHAAERGAFEQVPEELRPHVAGYFAALKEHRLQVIPEYVERTVIVKSYHVAGTFDNLVRCPDGKIRVLDKKTGRLDYSDVEFAIQMALYANANAIFNYDTGRYEPMPEVAKDYAILMHIDPETGKAHPERVNIAWGWTWARTSAEVMAIRKTKSIVTPYVTDESVEAQWSALPETDTVSPYLNNGNPQDYPARIPDEDRVIGTVPGGYVDSTSSVPSEFQAFWSDDRHDTDLEPAELNGVPVAEYGKPSTWPCSRGEACEFTGADGLHTDGTVCLVGNARPAPIPPGIVITQQGAVLAEDIAGMTLSGTCGCGGDDPGGHVDGCPNDTHESGEPTVESQDAAASNWDDLVAKIDKLKTKAAVQEVARNLMSRLGIKEGDPGAIKLNQWKINLAKAAVTLAHKHGVPIIGPGDEVLGVPTGPAPTNTTSRVGAQAPKAVGVGGAEVAADTALREEQVRTAVESIKMQGTIEGLQDRHAYYVQTTLGWTDEMQNAARVRAAELDQQSGEVELTPLEMIQGATSKETLAKAWQKATDGGKNMNGWTDELNAAAIDRQSQLSGVATSGNQ
jgi:hypothetical protein